MASQATTASGRAPLLLRRGRGRAAPRLAAVAPPLGPSARFQDWNAQGRWRAGMGNRLGLGWAAGRATPRAPAPPAGSLADAEEPTTEPQPPSPLPPPPSNGKGIQQGTARLMLLGVSMLWASYGPSVRFMFTQDNPPDPFVLTALRGSIASLLLLPALLAASPPKPEGEGKTVLGRELSATQALWLGALELGMWNFAGTAFQAYGIQVTSATRAGFLTQSTSLFTPVIAAAFGERVPAAVWYGCGLGVVGGLIMSTDGGGGAAAAAVDATGGSLRGDALVLCGAAMYGMLTVRLSALARANDPSKLAAAKTTAYAGVAVLTLGWQVALLAAQGAPITSLWEGWRDPVVWGVIVFTGIGPGALAAALQARGQSAVPAAEAQVFYSFTPFFGALLAVSVLGESVGGQTWAGGALIVAAGLVAARTGGGGGEVEEGGAAEGAGEGGDGGRGK